MCGIIGVSNRRDAANLAHMGLHGLQHRGQEAAGIVVSDGEKLEPRIGSGLASIVFNPEDIARLKGRYAVGHVRYSTAGVSNVKNAQPLLFSQRHGQIAIAHNGNLTNARTLRKKLEEKGAIFQSSSDTEVLMHLLAREKRGLEQALIRSVRKLEGAFSFLLMTPKKMVAIRDPFGFRPLVIGKVGAGYVFASETGALGLLGARFVREVEPGEMVVAKGAQLRSKRGVFKSASPHGEAKCIFEHVYFARPDSEVFGRGVYQSRKAMGRELALEMPGIRADFVLPVPDSGVPAALGFSQQAKIPMEIGLIRSHYSGRTFIQPLQSLRDLGVRLKLSPVAKMLKGKDVVLVDDSIVRGTTSRKIVRMLRAAKIGKIHFAIASPAIVSPCYYGIDTPKEKDLIAARKSLPSIRRYLDVDSIHYLSESGLLRAVGGEGNGFCMACFTRRYPTPLRDLKRVRRKA